MKSSLLVAAVLVCTQISAGTVPEKNMEQVTLRQSVPPSFAFLRGHRQGRSAKITWGMNSNAGINRFDVECTYEDPNDPYSNWDIRGSTPNANVRSFNFLDNDILPGTMNYRIIARMNDGSSVVSDVETIRIATH